jgi:hypothetical protein
MKITALGLAFLAWGSACVLWAGTSTASWLLIPTSARQAALSGSFGALADDLDALGVNPAGLAKMTGNQISVLTTQWAQDLAVEHLSYGRGFGEWAGGAVGLDYLDFGRIDGFSLNPSGTPVANGVLSPMAMNFYAGFGWEAVRNMDVGLDVKVILQNLQNEQSYTAAADLGWRYRIPKAGLSLGLALLNLGGTLDGGDLPALLSLSGGYQAVLAPDHQINLAADSYWNLLDSSNSTASLGMEYWFRGQLALRTGYRFAPYGNLAGFYGFSAGVGIKWGRAELGYALTTLGEMGSGHQISVKAGF